MAVTGVNGRSSAVAPTICMVANQPPCRVSGDWQQAAIEPPKTPVQENPNKNTINVRIRGSSAPAAAPIPIWVKIY